MTFKHASASALLGFALLLAAPAGAQTVMDPTTAEFDPSPDHNTLVDDVPMLERYELEIYAPGVTPPVRTLNLGKPAPAADGKIRTNFALLLVPPLTPGPVYTAAVVAVGPGGRSASPVSIDSFSYTPPLICTYGVSPTSQNVIAAGQGGTVTVTAPAGCAWTATEGADWLTITNATLSGNGTVSYAATENPSASIRTATLTVAGITVNITQAGTCSYGVSATGQTFDADGGAGTIGVTAGADCDWTATETASWLTITSGASLSGNGTVGYTVMANTATTGRSATITVAEQDVTITQSGAACTYVVAPLNPNVGPGSSNNSLTVTTTADCAWTAAENAPWLTITSGPGGTGSGLVTYSVMANTAAARNTTLTIAGATVTVTQATSIPQSPGNLRIVP